MENTVEKVPGGTVMAREMESIRRSLGVLGALHHPVHLNELAEALEITPGALELMAAGDVSGFEACEVARVARSLRRFVLYRRGEVEYGRAYAAGLQGRLGVVQAHRTALASVESMERRDAELRALCERMA